jgi:hypothetical protein
LDRNYFFISPEKCPVVIRLNGSDTYFCDLDKRPVKWSNKFHEKRALQKADALLSVSQFTADKTNEVLDSINNSRLFRIQLMLPILMKVYDSITIRFCISEV